MTTVGAARGMVVVRYRDGRVLKGITKDFSANRSELHVFEGGDEKNKPAPVQVAELKAIFFVRSYGGDPRRSEYKLFDRSSVQARKVLVRFRDGEVLVGYTVGYDPKKQGFFVTPADPESNNERVYVINAAVSKVHCV